MQIIVNGKPYDTNPEQNLLEFLREDLGLTGAKDGCGIGACGSCTVLFDLKPVKACQKKVKDAAGICITTIEGLQNGASLHPLQQAFLDAGAVQCGFCIPGMVLTGHAFLLKNPNPTRNDIREAINPNLCRCTGYQQIINAIQSAAKHYVIETDLVEVE